MSTSDTELVRMQRAKWALLSHAIKAQFVIVGAALMTAIEGGSVTAWVGLAVTIIGSALSVWERWTAEGPLLLRRPGRVVVVEPPHDPEAR